MQDEQSFRRCPICGSSGSRKLKTYSTDEWVNVECSNCAFVFLGNPPEYAALEEEYAWEKTSEQKKAENKRGSTPLSPAVRVVRNALRPIRNKNRLLLKLFGGGKVLDIGCGNGDRLPEPITPYGIELSLELHREADERMRLRGGYCLQGPGAERIGDFPEEFFDGILMRSYLEHETGISGVMRGSHLALKPGGKVYVRVPNYGSLNRKFFGRSWCGFRFPDHVNYFEKRTMKALAEKIDFELSVVNFLRHPFDDNLTVVLRKA